MLSSTSSHIRNVLSFLLRPAIPSRLGQTTNRSLQTASEPETHFGFETVKENEKSQKVHKVFEEVASSYDLMNDAMSFGIHRIWKDIFLERLAPIGGGIRLLDMAGGTGDIAFRYLKYLDNLPQNEGTQNHVTISDINQDMLNVGKERFKLLNRKQNNHSIDWVCADAEKLPFENNSYSAYTIAFGIRNVTHIDKVLSEAYRVLQPGGRFLSLEFSHVTNDYIKWIYDQYSFQMIPPMGQILANQWHPYKYLVESIRKFPNQEEFKKLIQQAGFKCVEYENLTFGVCAIHSGFKL
ncbi:2-methoxy-6-polyprenyl-1,4-benzoquinol methylase, mitochondrial [Toxorhynchites rutilus septentrionalis]|uniref:2-methoxy-6-polyprenyl-1,4-benzoquinol methylase, mitochondrial n=1 Tax=Toxorhynchites rutilus septentrionalis TaxID=329112 RepID=UPI00247902CA|nr:2-methoxy-6-polyprenyl-1,4-benzoquinol methylase, mitochondrial [Toxorhynchites rutilus septentrionalis]